MWKRLLLASAMSITSAAQNVPTATMPSQPPSPLVLEWSNLPNLVGNVVKGSVIATNNSDIPFDQTIVVEAVNEIGKAFAIGYGHFTLDPHSQSERLRFNMTLPPGHYQIHADGVAEEPKTRSIYRRHIESPMGFVVTII